MALPADIIAFFNQRRKEKNLREAIRVFAELFDFFVELRKPTTVRFVVPRHRNPKTGEWKQMPTLLLDDQISNIPLEFDNLGGEVVDPPAGGQMTVSLDNTAMGTVAVGADGKSVDYTPAVPPPAEGTAGTITFQDQSGTVTLPATLAIATTRDPNAANVHFDTQNITNRPIAPTP